MTRAPEDVPLTAGMVAMTLDVGDDPYVQHAHDEPHCRRDDETPHRMSECRMFLPVRSRGE